MISGEIKDWQLAASSSNDERQSCAIKHARIHAKGSRAWCAGVPAKNEWILVDLGVPATISGIMLQGRGVVDEWVTHFIVSYSLDAYKWDFARDVYGNKKVIIVVADFLPVQLPAKDERNPYENLCEIRFKGLQGKQ